MATVIEERRLELLAAIQTPNDIIPAWRTHAFPPSNLVAPCVYLDMPRLYYLNQWVTADWPIVAVVDSQDISALSALDQLVSVIWDRLSLVDGTIPQSATAGSIDVGGVRLRSYEIVATTALTPETLCPAITLEYERV
jgi:hypothetical protein